MLSQEDNELLVHVGPATPMGNLFRRFWTPVALVSELGAPDAPPVRVRVFGENFVAFRDSDGEAALLDAYCPHRRANLFWGRNEARGLRCAYHGWKLTAPGSARIFRTAPRASSLHRACASARIRCWNAADPVGVFGATGTQAGVSAIEALEVPASHRHVIKVVADGNWLQFQEGDVDSSHVAFLHGRVDGKVIEGSRLSPNTYNDKAPRWFPSETDYGLPLAAQRDAGPERYQWRVNQYLMPHVTLIANQPHLPTLAQIRTPIDDEHAILFRYLATYDRPLSDDERRIAETNGTNFPDLVPGTFTMRESRANDYAIDREVQRNETFTGIKSTVAQDLAVTQEQGDAVIADRSREYLVSRIARSSCCASGC